MDAGPVKIKVSNDLAWLLPFIRELYHHSPDIVGKIKEIRSYKVSLEKEIQNLGSSRRIGKYYSIWLLSHWNCKGRYVKRYMGSILEVLAHELAHLVCWEHTGTHFIAQAYFIYVFGRVMEKLKIKNYVITRMGRYDKQRLSRIP